MIERLFLRLALRHVRGKRHGSRRCRAFDLYLWARLDDLPNPAFFLGRPPGPTEHLEVVSVDGGTVFVKVPD